MPSTHGIRNVDVIVVGAGLSGLTAALNIQKAGYTVAVLEARDRVGGKTLTKDLASGKGRVDVGAAWLNEKTQPKIFALAKKYGFDTVVQPTAGDGVFQDMRGKSERVAEDAAPPLPRETLEMVGKIEGELDAEAAKLDIHHLPPSKFDDITVSQYLRRKDVDKTSFELIQIMPKALLGVDASELSLYYYLDYIKSGGGLDDLGSDKSNGAQYMRLRQGMQSISKGIAAELKLGLLFLESPVISIHQQESPQCIVTTQTGLVFHAKKVIISVPTPLYRTMTFSPVLPKAKSTLANSTMLGYYAKTILIYKKPWWRTLGLNGAFTSLTGYVSFTRDTSVEQDLQYSITCFIVGGTGREWSALSPKQRLEAVLDQIVSMVGEDHRHLVCDTEETIEQEWIKEPWSQGAPSPVMGPGLLNKYAETLREPWTNVHFVGTETAFEWKGYMEGAVRAGERGATEVVEALGRGVD